MLSLPRDLAVTIPGYADGVKINQAYDEGGAALTLETVKLPVRERDGREVHGQQRHRRQLQRLPARGQLRQGRLRRRRPQVLQPPRARASRRSTSSRLPAARRLGRARLRPLPPHGLRHLPQRAPAGLPAPGRQPARGARAATARARRASWSSVFRRYFRFDKKFMTRQEPRRPAQDRRSRSPFNHAPVNQIALAGDHRVREPDRGHAAVHLQREPHEGLRRVHDRRGDDATRSAREKTEDGQASRRKASTVSGLVNARRLGEDLAVLAPRRLRSCRSTSRSCSRTGSQYVNETPRIYSLARRGRQAPPRLPDRGLGRRARRVLGRPGHDLARPADPRQPRPRSARRTAAS